MSKARRVKKMAKRLATFSDLRWMRTGDSVIIYTGRKPLLKGKMDERLIIPYQVI